MKFLLTMNMPSHQGRQIHQIICSVDGVASIEGFWKTVTDNQFIIVNEYYHDANVASGYTVGSKYNLRGKLVLNTDVIGKAKEMEERP